MQAASNLIDRFAAAAALSERGRAMIVNIGWTGAAQSIGIVVRLGSNLVLTRLLAPELFGLIGTAFALLALLDWLSDLGLQPAVIRHERGDSYEVTSTAWWIGLVRAVALFTLGAAAAIPLANFYSEPILAGVVTAMCLRPIIVAFRSPAFPLLRREMNYRAIFFDEIAQITIGTGTSLAIAVATGSVWAIVGGLLAGTVASVIVSWRMCPRKITRPCGTMAWELLRFSGPVFLNTLVMAAWLNLDRLLGLKLLGAAEVGLYVVAFNLAGAAEALVVRMCDVYFSAISQVDAEDRDGWHARQVEKVARWLAPAAAFGILLAPFVVTVLYDARYHPAGPILAVLGARLMLRAFGQFRFQHLMAQARVRIATVGYALALIVQAVCIIPLATHFGVMGLAISVLVSTGLITIVQELCVCGHRVWQLKPMLWTFTWAAASLAVIANVT